jgi:hypothetical protein
MPIFISPVLITLDISGIVFKGTWNKADVAIKVFKLAGTARPREAVTTFKIIVRANDRDSNVTISFASDPKRSVDLGQIASSTRSPSDHVPPSPYSSP